MTEALTSACLHGVTNGLSARFAMRARHSCRIEPALCLQADAKAAGSVSAWHEMGSSTVNTAFCWRSMERDVTLRG